MGDSTIGIKVADGSYYPVLEQGFTGRKKLVLTTAKDNQTRVQIDLYRGNGSSLTQARYLGSLIIENIPPAAQGEPEIELSIALDVDGQLSAEASDTSTGESQRFATSLAGPSEAETSLEPEYVLEPGTGTDFEEPPLTGEDYAAAEAQPRAERARRKGPNLLLLVLFVVLGVLLVAAVAYFVYRSIQGPQIPPLPTTVQAAPAPAAAAQPAAPAAQPAAPAAQTEAQPAAQASSPKQPSAVSYLIKTGDTLWDLSATYYRNPWLYPKLAKANGIRNPDLIFAGTRITIPAN